MLKKGYGFYLIVRNGKVSIWCYDVAGNLLDHQVKFDGGSFTILTPGIHTIKVEGSKGNTNIKSIMIGGGIIPAVAFDL
jgi:hypothetical protein